mgnify:CR=1 FL=1
MKTFKECFKKHKTNPHLKRKVFVAMSGGVDSSVAAALLKRDGYEVTGVFIKIWDPELSTCDWRAERRDALRATAKISVPLLTLDLSRDYKKLVINYLLSEYKLGRTPNPDVMCNKEIKFGLFYREALRLGADFIATGHYAIRRENDLLGISKDKEKDQTYFLWTIKQEILKHGLFPIGKYKKSEVRKLATKFDLSNAAKPDSQGLCFLGQIDFKTFLGRHLPKRFGKVLDEKGREIGEHNGVHFYTIGERHGFQVTVQTPASVPLYVIAKNVEKNILVVSPQPAKSMSAQNEIMLDQINWIIGLPPLPTEKLKARIRYRAPLVSCRVESLDHNRARVVFDKPLFGSAPGQSCVFYDSRGLICLGGGVII